MNICNEVTLLKLLSRAVKEGDGMKLKKGNLGYGLFFDNLLNLSVGSLREIMNKFILLYQGVIVPDSWLLTNKALLEILTDNGDLLIHEGLLIPAMRDTVQTFQEFFKQSKEKKMYGLSANENHIALLDGSIKVIDPILFQMSQVGENYHKMSSMVLERDFLINAGVTSSTADIVHKIIKKARAEGVETNTNTFVKDVICPQLPSFEQAWVMEIARAPYGLNIPSLLGTGVAGPEGFKGDQILAALKGQSLQRGVLNVGVEVENVIFSSLIGNPLVNWLFSADTLATLRPEELVIICKRTDKGTYLDDLSAYLTNPNDENGAILAESFLQYFSKAGEDILERRIKSETRFAEPEQDLVFELVGDSTIHVKTPHHPVDLNALPDMIVASESLQLIGRALKVPTNIKK